MAPKQDTRADVRFVLEGEVERDGLMVYPPGATVTGRFELMPNRDLECRHLLLQLEWHTEGRGDRDGKVIEEADLFQGVLTAGVSIGEDFVFTLPDQPWSYAGHYVNIVWAVSIKIDIPRAKDVNASQPFIMTPDRDRVTPESAPDSIW
jgi:hypothetical protein